MNQRAKWYPGRENGMKKRILVIGISYQVEKDDQKMELLVFIED